jgi:chemotaxis protein CheX
MVLDDDFIRELTRVVWTTVVGIEAEQGGPDAAVPAEITTSVDISGAWEGTVSLSFSHVLAQRLAAAVLACPESETTPALVTDVVSELANVLGGNLKGALPGECKLSLPRVETDVSSATDVDSRMWFDCAGQPFSVTVRARQIEIGSAE